MNEFEEFALQFRRRTAARMLEFEATMENVQRDVEKAAAQQSADRKLAARARPIQQPPKTGQVKSVLRRG